MKEESSLAPVARNGVVHYDGCYRCSQREKMTLLGASSYRPAKWPKLCRVGR